MVKLCHSLTVKLKLSLPGTWQVCSGSLSTNTQFIKLIEAKQTSATL